MMTIASSRSLYFFRYTLVPIAVVALTALHPLNTALAQTLADALDAPQLTWTTGGNQPWVGQTTVRHDGVDAARCGAIGNSQESWLQTTVTGPGTLAFWWKVSSEQDFDFLEFRVNGNIQAGPITGEVDWQQVIFELGTGSQTLRWRYYKDSSAAAGQDRGWVDTVRFIPLNGPPVILTDPLSRTAEEGTSVAFEVEARGSSPLIYQWYHGNSPMSGAQSAILTLNNLTAADAGEYTVRVENSLNSVTSAPALLTIIPATLDFAFNAGVDGPVTAIAVQPDGKILIGGNFTTLGGQPRENLGRLNADGSLDPDFDPGASTGFVGGVMSLVVQPDGKILVGGNFASLAGENRDGIGRLNADGSIDTGFAPVLDNYTTLYVGSIVLQPDGKILIGGSFDTVGGEPRGGVARLNANGTLDTTFDTPFSSGLASGSVDCLALQSNGSILVGGGFSLDVVDSDGDVIGYFNLVRLGSNGGLDESFYPDPDGWIRCMLVQPDGGILISGGFTRLFDANYNEYPRTGFGRINDNSIVDGSFNPVTDGEVLSMSMQADGKIIVAGDFSTLGGQLRDGLGRLNANGTIDNTFVPGADGPVESLAVQSDGRIVVGGNFTVLGGQPRGRLGRLNATPPATQSLNYTGTTITWLRGGTSPEVLRTTFEHTADGNTWISLGAGSRVTGGWQRTGVSIPAGNTIRARGYGIGGYLNSSGSIVEMARGKPAIAVQPESRTNNFGTTATFSVVASVAEPLSYQWLKNGVPLSSLGNISGAKTNLLTITALSKSDEGSFRVMVTNSFGSVTSLGATLTVRDPYITQQPASLVRSPGQNATFTVTAVGSSSLSYQWYQDGSLLPGASGPTLLLPGLSLSHAGLYTVVISSTQDSITSTPALLTINAATVDSTFNPGADGPVYTFAVQSDGKILVGGNFTTLGGQSHSRIGRLNADGTVDPTFTAGAAGVVSTLALQENGKILVGGSFSSLAGQTRNCLGRLNADGTLDTTFNPGAIGGSFPQVVALLQQVDGKILVGGDFTTLAGQSRLRLGRLNENGSIDTTFNPGASGGFYPVVLTLALQPDGKILVGGDFTNLGGQPRNYLARLNASGTLDAAFNPGSDGPVFAFAVQADEKILIGGRFFEFGGQPRESLARVDAGGTLDAVFDPGASGAILTMSLQADGKVLVGGEFNYLGEHSRNAIGRLGNSGAVDGTFDPDAEGGLGPLPAVIAMAVQPDGKILVGGEFTSLGGQSRERIARLNNTAPASQLLSYSGNTVTWQRSGPSPEVWRTTFEHTSDGQNWTSLGNGVRIAGGWQLTGVSLPAGGILRARGQAVGSFHSTSWFVEELIDLSSPIHLSLVREGSTMTLGWTGGIGPFQVQQASDLRPPISWQDVGSPVQNNSLAVPLGPENVFWRIRRP